MQGNHPFRFKIWVNESPGLEEVEENGMELCFKDDDATATLLFFLSIYLFSISQSAQTTTPTPTEQIFHHHYQQHPIHSYAICYCTSFDFSLHIGLNWS